jgi:Arc/MetJ-type ribon-helix-helix transcriptional regulator
LRYNGVCCGILPRKEKSKLKTSVALDEELLEWVDSLIETKRFANRTHAIEFALQRLRESGYGKE